MMLLKLSLVISVATLFAFVQTNLIQEDETIDTEEKHEGDYNVAAATVNKTETHQYCARCFENDGKIRVKRQRPAFMRELPLLSMNELIRDFRAKALDRNNRDISFISRPPEPFTEVVLKKIHLTLPFKMVKEIPIYLKATIKSKHFPIGTRPAIPQEVEETLQAIGKYDTDDAGHLLAYSIGGGMGNTWNYVPQAKDLNRNVRGHSNWFDEEKKIADFLKANRKGYVDWSVYVYYGSTDPNALHRPRAFCLNHTDVANNGVTTTTNDIYFSNDQYRDRESNTYKDGK